MKERMFRFVYGNKEEVTPLNVIKEAAGLDPAVPLDYEEEQELLGWYHTEVFIKGNTDHYWEEV